MNTTNITGLHQVSWPNKNTNIIVGDSHQVSNTYNAAVAFQGTHWDICIYIVALQ